MGAAIEYGNFHGIANLGVSPPSGCLLKIHVTWSLRHLVDVSISYQDISPSLDQKIIKPMFYRLWKLVCFNFHYGSCFLRDFFIQLSDQKLEIQGTIYSYSLLMTSASCDNHAFSGVIERANLVMCPCTDDGLAPTHMHLFLFLPLSFGNTNGKLKCYAL